MDSCSSSTCWHTKSNFRDDKIWIGLKFHARSIWNQFLTRKTQFLWGLVAECQAPPNSCSAQNGDSYNGKCSHTLWGRQRPRLSKGYPRLSKAIQILFWGPLIGNSSPKPNSLSNLKQRCSYMCLLFMFRISKSQTLAFPRFLKTDFKNREKIQLYWFVSFKE